MSSSKASPTKCHPNANDKSGMTKETVVETASDEDGGDGQQPSKRVEFSVKHEDRIKIEIPIEEEELLGSVTTLSSPAVRASARVIQKMKLDLIRPASPPPPEKKESAKEAANAQKTPVQVKAPKVIWTNVERNLFFDAINESGKDFDAIAHYINVKQRRKSPTDPTFKTKDHVRLLYYQTFHKISKYLRFSDDIKKNAQELYALVNYGEMRKKLVFINQKVCMKLKELVYQGSVTVRFKGKNIRIKTPSCKALRKLNQLEEWQEEIKLPSKVDVFLKPANADSWAHVQKLAQNPRVKTVLPLQKRLLSLIKTMQTRWRTREARLCDETMTIQPSTSAASSTAQLRNAHHDARPDADTTRQIHDREPMLSFAPPPNTVIHRPMVNLVEFLSSYSICLNSYEDRIGVSVRGETLSTERINSMKEIIRAQSKRQRHDSRCAEQKSPEYKRMKSDPDLKAEASVPVAINETADSGKDDSVVSNPFEIEGISQIESSADESDCKDEVKTCNLDVSSESDISSVVASDFRFPTLPVDLNTSNTIPLDVGVTVDGADTKPPPDIVAQPAPVAPVALDKAAIAAENRAKRKESKSQANKKRDTHRKENFRPLLDEEMIAKIMRGWRVADVGDLTIGDLYIMFGQNFQVNLEYSWYEPELPKAPVEVVADAPEVPLTPTVDPVPVPEAPTPPRNPLSNKLKQLLLLANMAEKTKKKTNCTCGHFCDKGYKAKNKDDGLPRSYISNKIYPSSHSDNTVFRHPTMLPGMGGRPGASALEAYRLTLTHSRNKQNRWIRSRNMRTSKQVVVQRLLPVQPGAAQSYDVIGSADGYHSNGLGHQAQSITGGSPSSSSRILLPSTPSAGSSTNTKNGSAPPGTTNVPSKVHSHNPPDTDTTSTSDSRAVDSTNENDDSLVNDPGIQSLMDISLPSPTPTISNIDEIFSYSNCPMSPMTMLRQSPADPRWFDDNVNDFSLSSFLGHLEAAQQNDNASVETPKKSTIHHADIDNSRLSSLGDSVDYMSKFEEIAQSMLNREQTND